METAGLVIVGASYAGIQVADAARAKGYQGRIRLVGDEAVAPYQRPPLSKGLLLGKQTPEALTIRAPAYFEEQRIELVLNTRIESIDRAAKTVHTHDGSTMAYDWLVLATGARCREISMPESVRSGIYTLRSLEDGLAIQAMAAKAQRVCVIGAGFIGLEVASALTQRGLHVDVVEAGARVLQRSVPEVVSSHFESLHRERGVQLHLGAAVAGFEADAQGAVQAVLLHNGQRLACDAVVVGIGVQANEELA
ncbi:MAG: NAD(P)/FAD-dependent oxidoreductase, partial [Comamonas sp.]